MENKRRTASLLDIRDIIEIALDSFDDSLPDIQLDTNIYDKCGLDSMGAVAMVVEIQRRFGKRIPDAVVPELYTPAKLMDYINRNSDSND